MRSQLFFFSFVCCFANFAAFAQIIDDPHAAPFSLDVHCNAPSNTLLKVVITDKNSIAGLFGQEFTDGSVTRVFDCAPSRSEADIPFLQEPLYPRIIPGETYYVYAELSSAVSSGADIELMFDVPTGYRLFVDGLERDHIDGSISTTRRWTFVLERDDTELSTSPGSRRGPYFGSNYLFDISLGTMPEGFDAGLLRVDREAFLNMVGDRSLIIARQRFIEMTFVRDSGAPDAKLRQIYLPGVLVHLDDISGGCTVEFFDAPNQPPLYDHDGDPATPMIHDTSNLTLIKKWTITAHTQTQSGLTYYYLNLHSDQDGMIWEAQIEHVLISSGQWKFSSGKLADGNWLSVVRYVTLPPPPGTPGNLMRTISVSGVEDLNLNGNLDSGEAINYQTVRQEIFENVSAYQIGPTARRLIRSTDAPGTSNERITTYTYHNSVAGHAGKIHTITSPTGNVKSYSYYTNADDIHRRARGRLLQVQSTHPVAFDANATNDYSADAVMVKSFAWHSDSASEFFDFNESERITRLVSGSTERMVSRLEQSHARFDGVREERTLLQADGSSTPLVEEAVIQFNDYTHDQAPGRLHGNLNPATGLGSVSTYLYGHYNPNTDQFVVAPATGEVLRTEQRSGIVVESQGNKLILQTLLPGTSKRTFTYARKDGKPIRQRKYAYAKDESTTDNAEWKLIGDQKFIYDSLNRLVSVQNMITGETEVFIWNGYRLQSHTKPNGIVISHEYDALGRVMRSTQSALAPTNLGSGQTDVSQSALITEFVHDPRGNRRVVRRKSPEGSGDTDVLTETYIYNLFNEVVESIQSCGMNKQISKQISNISGEGYIVTETEPTGVQRISVYSPDGRILRATNEDGLTTYHHYGVSPSGGMTALVRFGSDTSNAPFSWEMRDWRGNVIESRVPALNDFASTGSVVDRVTRYSYDAQGRVTGVLRDDKPTVRFAYGIAGMDDFVRRIWLDLNDDGIFDATGDPGEEVYTRFHVVDGHTWRSTSNYVYADEGSDVRALTGEERHRYSGFSPTLLGEVSLIDNNGHATTMTLTANGPQRIRQVVAPVDGSNTLSHKSVFLHDRLYREEDGYGRIATYAYDALARRVQAMDFEGNSHLVFFKMNCSLVDYEITGPDAHHVGYTRYDHTAPVGSRNQVNYRFVLASGHSQYGQSSASINPSTLNPETNTNVVSVERYTYSASTRVNEVYQGGLLRTRTIHDEFGRRRYLRLFQSPGAYTQVEWQYHAKTGQLLARKDPGPPGHSTVTETYRYHRSGELYKIIDPRGVETTFTYGDVASGYDYGKRVETTFGNVGAIATPPVVQSHNRMRSLASLDNGVTGLQSYTYDKSGTLATLRLEEIAFDNTFYLGAVDRLALGYEVANGSGTLKGRPNGFQYMAGSQVVAGSTYGYDAYNRLASVTAHGFWGQSELEGTRFEIGYDAQHDRVNHVASPLLARGDGPYAQVIVRNAQGRITEVAAGHDRNGDGVLSTQIDADFVNARYRYTYDAAGRIEWEQSDGFLFGRYPDGGIATQYAYDQAGRLKSAITHTGTTMSSQHPRIPGREYGYGYDHAGNRLFRSVDGEVFDYTVESNAYSSRINPDYAVYSGMSVNPVSINGQSPNQMAPPFFRHHRAVVNSENAVWDVATIIAGGQSVSRGVVVPEQDQIFIYDASGNLLEDGVWVYQYDAMNRLRAMERNGQIAGLPASRDVRLEFAYDEQNRRVEKVVRDRVGGAERKRERFLYEGWNLVATLFVEGSGSSQAANLGSRYVWRTSSLETGSFGLLMVAGDHDGNPATARRAYYPGYDGRGNVTTLADNHQGVAAAGYEYSPYGELLRSESNVRLPDVASLGAHFGFATQYRDEESGLIYFGHRYYHPGLGRFLSRDPIREEGGVNLYAYANNDPVNYTDYRGLCYNGPADTAGWNYFNSLNASRMVEGYEAQGPFAWADEERNRDVEVQREVPLVSISLVMDIRGTSVAITVRDPTTGEERTSQTGSGVYDSSNWTGDSFSFNRGFDISGGFSSSNNLSLSPSQSSNWNGSGSPLAQGNQGVAVEFEVGIREPHPEAGVKASARFVIDPVTGKIISEDSSIGTTSLFGREFVGGGQIETMAVFDEKSQMWNIGFRGNVYSKPLRFAEGAVTGIMGNPNATLVIDFALQVQFDPVSRTGVFGAVHDAYPSYQIRVGGAAIYDSPQHPIPVIKLDPPVNIFQRGDFSY